MQAYERLKQAVAEAEEDIRKAEGGNKAAGTRARKQMQEVKKVSQEVRQALLDLRDAEESGGGTSAPGGGAGGERPGGSPFGGTPGGFGR